MSNCASWHFEFHGLWFSVENVPGVISGSLVFIESLRNIYFFAKLKKKSGSERGMLERVRGMWLCAKVY